MANKNKFPNNPVELQYADPPDQVKFSPNGSETFVDGNALSFKHWVALPDPLYNKNIGGIRNTLGEVQNSQFLVGETRFVRENGFLYICMGTVRGVYTSNNKKLQHAPGGEMVHDTAMLTINRCYVDSNQKVAISEYDKLIPLHFPQDFYSVNWEKIQHNHKGGVDTLQFPAKAIQWIMDSTGKIFNHGVDFTINDNGNLKWIGKTPGIDPDTQEGRIFSIRYMYSPYYYVSSIPHNIRIEPRIGPTGQATYKISPLTISVQAEYLFVKKRGANFNEVPTQSPAANVKEDAMYNQIPDDIRG